MSNESQNLNFNSKKNIYFPKIAIIIVTWNSEKYLTELFRTLKEVDYSAEKLRFFFIDNGSDDNSVRMIKRSGFHVIKNNRNEGFARANNHGADKALKWGAEYLYFLNPDTEVDPAFLKEALEVFSLNRKVGQVQSLTFREGGELVQSCGNCLTFLGFGYSGGDGIPVDMFWRHCNEFFSGREQAALTPYPKKNSSQSRLSVGNTSFGRWDGEGGEEIGYASGAAMMVSAKVWKEVGGFDEIYESFHEDTDLSLKIRLAGYRIVIAPGSRVIHKYEFARSIKNYYYLERNRYILGMKFFKMPTLILFLPAFFVMEVGTFMYSMFTGFWKEKLRAYLWLFIHLEKVWESRMDMQRNRKFGDKALVKYLSAKVDFQEIMNPILQYLVNPAMEVYWRIVKRFIVW